LTVTIRWQERNQDRTFVLVRLMKDRPATSAASTTGTSSSSSPTAPK
jgi:hypothetical protein